MLLLAIVVTFVIALKRNHQKKYNQKILGDIAPIWNTRKNGIEKSYEV
jgi:hypothetical protein